MIASTALSMAVPPWIALSGGTPGKRHLREGIACQDAAFASAARPRPWLTVADGRGSAAHSDLGAQTACMAVAERVEAGGGLFAAVLDLPDAERAAELRPVLKDLLVQSVLTRQRMLALELGLERQDLEHTLLVVLVGTKRLFALHVGDGAIVGQKAPGTLFTLSAPERGEYANVTCFVGPKLTVAHVRDVLVEVDGVRAVAAMSDGAAERLVHARSSEPAPGVATLFDRIREQRFNRRDLHRFLTDTFWEPIVQDDRSMAILCRGENAGSGVIADGVNAAPRIANVTGAPPQHANATGASSAGLAGGAWARRGRFGQGVPADIGGREAGSSVAPCGPDGSAGRHSADGMERVLASVAVIAIFALGLAVGLWLGIWAAR